MCGKSPAKTGDFSAVSSAKTGTFLLAVFLGDLLLAATETAASSRLVFGHQWQRLKSMGNALGKSPLRRTSSCKWRCLWNVWNFRLKWFEMVCLLVTVLGVVTCTGMDTAGRHHDISIHEGFPKDCKIHPSWRKPVTHKLSGDRPFWRCLVGQMTKIKKLS